MTYEVVGPYRKSSYSQQQGNCVEVAPTASNGRSVRDSKNLGGPCLGVTGGAWHAFILGVQRGEFDR
ncbi:DUF397 domain-containing protein [Streptomyces violaceusniger]|uniref:DUF397 domain-containing protein n=1 Tax=Streptomyces violaceusniger TaxID=68280 RepID=UPI00381EB0D2